MKHFYFSRKWCENWGNKTKEVSIVLLSLLFKTRQQTKFIHPNIKFQWNTFRLDQLINLRGIPKLICPIIITRGNK